MKIYRDIPLTKFEFWGGGKDRAECLTDDELNQIERILEFIYPEGLSEGEINNMFWFEDDMIAEWLGYGCFEEILMEREELQ